MCSKPSLSMISKYTFKKEERLCSNSIITKLFSEGNRSIGCFPIRLVFLILPSDKSRLPSLLISAPKRNFKLAVDRNRIKRQIREIYRVSNGPLTDVLEKKNHGLAIALLFTDKKIWDSKDLKPRLQTVLDNLVKSLDSDLVK
jgi:ribonuclease P protein component